MIERRNGIKKNFFDAVFVVWRSVAKIRMQKRLITQVISLFVPRTRVELARRNRHHPLKVACLPIPPPGHKSLKPMQKYTLLANYPNFGRIFFCEKFLIFIILL